ncbi:putative bifunctional diguanylate cyclase/phosphodiesterase [Nitratifractor sp.]
MINGLQLAIATAVGLIIALAGFWIWKRKKQGNEAELDDLIELYRTACKDVRDTMFILDRSNKIVYANEAARKIAPVQAGQNAAKYDDHFHFLLEGKDEGLTLSDLIRHHKLVSSSGHSVFRNARSGRENLDFVTIEINTYKSQVNPRQHYYIILIHNENCEKKLYSLHHINPLSGLSNQYKAFSDITIKTSQGKDRGRFAIMMLELDNASYLRSILGYSEIDAIITITANVLRELTAHNSRLAVYHLHYVNFMIFIHEFSSNDEIIALFEQFQTMLNEFYSRHNDSRQITFSAGVSIFPDNGTLQGLINGAYGALDMAQRQGTGQIVIAEKSYEKVVEREIELNAEIEKALQEKQIKLYFQPIFKSNDHSLYGAEILIRWHHPTRGIIMPDSFIPIAEKSGMITKIGKYVVEEAVKQIGLWNRYEFKPIILSINLSLRELEKLEFIENLTTTLYKYGVDGSRIKFEITEHASMLNPKLTLQKLNEIRQLGIDISLDDFGTGYSSFSYLVAFPISTLKIDKSFVRDIAKHEQNQHVVATMIKLAHSLGMDVVAEGVETKEDVTMVTSMGGDLLQGYYFSKPLPKLEFQHLLAEHSGKIVS